VDLPKVRGDNPPAIAASMLPSYLDMDRGALQLPNYPETPSYPINMNLSPVSVLADLRPFEVSSIYGSPPFHITYKNPLA